MRIKIIIMVALLANFGLCVAAKENSSLILGGSIEAQIPFDQDSDNDFGYGGTAKWLGDHIGFGVTFMKGSDEGNVWTREWDYTMFQFLVPFDSDLEMISDGYWIVGAGQYRATTSAEILGFDISVEDDGGIFEIGFGNRGKNFFEEIVYARSDEEDNKGGIIIRFGFTFF